jgi:hypothetical protein
MTKNKFFRVITFYQEKKFKKNIFFYFQKNFFKFYFEYYFFSLSRNTYLIKNLLKIKFI